MNCRFRSEQGTIRDLLAHRMCIERTDWILLAAAFDSTDEIVLYFLTYYFERKYKNVKNKRGPINVFYLFAAVKDTMKRNAEFALN